MSHSSQHTSHGGASHGSVRSYLTGFILSIILTVIPFAMVMNDWASQSTTLAIVIGMAVIQVIVHLIYFLHMNTSSQERWNLVALVFTAVIIGILVVGSLWIMYNLNINMMLD
ncbi:cytochrome o ubiquinol oxidase subunit IV [Serratia microhaemolytica]|uniref:cytochrome o ubiquinol oxidase subunit IV n=1 Tax=Serratia microhaemolytica TaxID=2675110 RepID=UPI000FDEF621|nr:cytochrome o ubiquinol oxidase subunit IV [Serratia microhaemolytica]